jgi:hypothetical protein
MMDYWRRMHCKPFVLVYPAYHLSLFQSSHFILDISSLGGLATYAGSIVHEFDTDLGNTTTGAGAAENACGNHGVSRITIQQVVGEAYG